MSILVGILVLGFLAYCVYAGYARVILVKKYSTHQIQLPELNDFSARPDELGRSDSAGSPNRSEVGRNVGDANA
ncbi:MAG TPA: hypothetical protein VMW80_11455 [Candidatus Dormibacteraeota bacterium]|nr:hypothetical protein [Candidatus Dormibacteraeota bacterium]